MIVRDLEVLYDYDNWANRKLFQVISGLAPQHFTQTVAGSDGSIRNTMVHAVSAKWGWLSRCGGGPERGSALKPADYPAVESLMETCSKVEVYVCEFLSRLKDDDLDRSVEFVNSRGEKRSMPLGELMQHAAIHGVHHRGQLALLLRLVGHVPGNFDMLFYFADRRSRVGVVGRMASTAAQHAAGADR